MNKTMKSARAGALWQGNKGLLQIGLQKIEIKMEKAVSDNPKSPEYRLLEINPATGERTKDLCGLFRKVTKTNKAFYEGTLNLGFANMVITIWQNEQKKSEKSPIMLIWGKLQMEKIGGENTSNEEELEAPDFEEGGEEVPF